MITKMTLETITDELASGYKQLKPETFQTSAELMAERKENKELRNKWFYTANFAMYEGDFLYFGERENNPILANIDDACEQLIKTGNYVVPENDVQKAKDSALKIKLSDLDLEKYDDEFSYFKIDTKKYDMLNETQNLFAEKVYGSLDESMKLLSDNGINKTRIYVLNPDYVKEKGVIARACWLNNFNNNSSLGAISRNVGNVYGGLRGVPKSAEGGANDISMEQILEASKTYVPESCWKEFQKEIGKLYKL